MTGLREQTGARWAGALALLVAVAYGIVRWAGTRPSFDAFGWLVWGDQTIHGTLDLGGAPSWKPLPWLFTTPYAVLGHGAQMWLWMVTEAAAALVGAVFAARVTFALGRRVGLERRAALAAAAFSAAALFGIQDYAHYVLSFQSDPMIVSCCLGALDCALAGRHRWGLTLITLAALGRPEAWPFLGLYALWLWRRHPSLRWLIGLELLVVPALWFGVPEITNGRPFVAGQLALNSPRAPHGNPVGTTISRFVGFHVLPVQLLALLAAVWAVRRRDRLLLGLVGATLGWVVVEMAFAVHGWAALPRYMFEAGATMVVLAGLGFGWLIGELPRVRIPRGAVPGWAGALVALGVAVVLVPSAVGRVRTEHRDLRRERDRTHQIAWLQTTIDRLGGPRLIRHCGRPTTSVRFVSVLAFMVRLNVGFVGHHPDRELRLHNPKVFFLSLPNGWSVLPYRVHRHNRHSCARLKAAFLFGPAYPTGLRARYRPASFL